MRVRIGEAAARLHVSTSTLRSWERRYGWPVPERTPGGQRTFAAEEIDGLRRGLAAGMSVSSAIATARGGAPNARGRLIDALLRDDTVAADTAMELAIETQTVERAIDGVLLSAVVAVDSELGAEHVRSHLSHRWAAGWILRMLRISSPGSRPSILVGDATGSEDDLDTLHCLALTLALRRGGARVVLVPAGRTVGLQDLAGERRFDAVVAVGSALPDDTVASWLWSIRRTLPQCEIACFRRRSLGPTGRVHALGTEATAAADMLLRELAARPPAASDAGRQAAARTRGSADRPAGLGTSSANSGGATRR